MSSGDGFHHRIRLAVRWGDMDAMGHVNNAAYFTYCESARMSYFEAIDMARHAERPDHGPAVVAASCNFRRQVRYPAELEVAVRTADTSRRSFTLEYSITDSSDGAVVADGSSVVVWVDYGAGRAIPLPQGLRRAIESHEGDR